MFCVHCGNSIHEEQHYCAQCGRVVKFHDSKAHVKTLDKWRNISYSMWVVLLFLCAIPTIVGWTLYYNAQNTLSKVVSEQLEAIRTDQITRAYYEYTSDEFKEKINFLGFKKFIKERSVFSKNLSFYVKNEATEGRDRTVNAVLVSKDGEEQEVHYRFVNKNGLWKIAKIRVKDANLAIDDEDERELKQVVSMQLKAVKNLDIADAYYTYTANEFQQITPLSSFQEFADFYSVMKRYEKVQFGEYSFEEDVVNWNVTLQDDEGSSEVAYFFCKEEGCWKIIGIQFNERSEREVHNPVDIVQAQLNAIRSHEVAKAYFEFTSKEFQKNTTLRDFKAFLKDQGSLYHNRDAKYHVMHNEMNSMTILATLTSMESQILPVEYELILEGDLWKIDQIQVKSS